MMDMFEEFMAGIDVSDWAITEEEKKEISARENICMIEETENDKKFQTEDGKIWLAAYHNKEWVLFRAFHGGLTSKAVWEVEDSLIGNITFEEALCRFFGWS